MSFSICGSIGANTGSFKCDRRRGIPKKVIVGSKSFTSNDYASSSAFDAAFLAAFKLATGNNNKLYPFPEITGVTDKTDANKEATLGSFGPKTILVEGKPSYEVDVVGTTTVEKSLRKFNGQQVPVFIVDDAGAVWGKLDSAGNFVGTDVLIFTTPHKYGDGSNGQTTKVSISFVSSGDVYDSAAFIQTGLSLSDMSGLVDVTLSEAAAHTANVYHVWGHIKTSGVGNFIDVADSYSAQLADATKWLAYTGATFSTSLAITSIAYNAATKAWDFTLDTTAYGALSAGAKIKLIGVDPTTLDTAGITGIEIGAIILTK